MNQLPTPRFTPIKPDPFSNRLLLFWQTRLERYGSEQILRWTLETFGLQTALALSWNDEETVLRSLLENLPGRIPTVEGVDGLLLHETWVSLSPDEAAAETFDGRKAGIGLWSRFQTENLCRKHEKTICRYRIWIVTARREQDASLETMPILTWSERFGVFRIAPLARWRTGSVREKIRRGPTVYSDSFSGRPGGDWKTVDYKTPYNLPPKHSVLDLANED